MSSSKPKKSMDVSAPGRSAPSATSRPIIVNHGPMIGDPMVQNQADEEELKSSSNATHRVISPATLGSVQKKVEEKSETPEPEAPKEEAKQESKTEDAPKPVVEPEKQDTEKPPESSTEAEVDAVAGQTKDKKQLDEAAKAEAERKAQIQKLIAEKKYFIPLSVSRHKKANRMTIFILVLLAVILGGIGLAFYEGLLGSTLLK